MKKMTSLLWSAALGLVALAGQAAPLNIAPVDGGMIPCLFSTNCTGTVQEVSSPFTLPGTGGAGYLHARIYTGEEGAPAAGHFGYEYRLDLTGIIADTNNPPCLTNLIRCYTNRVAAYSNRVTCRTNIVGRSVLVVSVTNRIPATNIVTCVTNEFPESIVEQCVTNVTGETICFTNVFPATNYVLCLTNRVREQVIISRQTNVVSPGTPFVRCSTNKIRYYTNVVTCRTNLVPCPGAPACIRSFRIDVGPILAQLDLDNDGTNTDQVYVITNGAAGAVAPAAIEWDDDELVLWFSPPLCVGESSPAIGIVSRARPHDAKADIDISPGGCLDVPTRGPKESRLLRCDLGDLASEIRRLRTNELTGTNDLIREERRAALLAYVQTAHDAAVADNLRGVRAALAHVIAKTDGHGPDWVTRDGAKDIKKEIKHILDCLKKESKPAKKKKHHDDDDDDKGRGSNGH